MATIDQLDLSVYNLYAIRTKMVEQINQEFRLDQAASVHPQLQMVDIYPKLSEIDILLGVATHQSPWAYFFAPKKFAKTRRSSFAFSRVIPSFGSDEEQEEMEEKLEQIEVDDEEEKEEKNIIRECFKQINKINEWMGFIVGRVGGILQG